MRGYNKLKGIVC